MAAITQTITVADFIVKDYRFGLNDAGEWIIYVRGDKVDAGGNVLEQDVMQVLKMPAARLATWLTFSAAITKAAKVKLGLDDGT